MRSVRNLGVRILSGSALVLVLLSPAVAGPPTDTLREYTEAVQKVLDDPALKADDRRHERRAAVRKLAIEAFDVQETARRALGPHWQPRTPAEREEFVQLFADLLEHTYIAKIDLYGGERDVFHRRQLRPDVAHEVARRCGLVECGRPVTRRLRQAGHHEPRCDYPHRHAGRQRFDPYSRSRHIPRWARGRSFR